ncbi:putative fatty acid oxygenase PpoA [Sphaerosporella brunnea]|uniref:Putative fatty acid oxygenase PpoA n=1 Tax=Sphaerosporella brunnea TaxID=1250544 RepID=A0A5J5EPB5_9PEZI|nr:putative fatty acid oxygenase PpoA [Sphaerosporella brunnea]
MSNSQVTAFDRESPGIFQRLRSLLEAVLRPPPPQLGDGLTDAEAEPTKVKETGIKEDLQSQGTRITKDIELLLDSLETFKNGGLINDRDYVVEKLIQLASTLPPHSRNQIKLTGQLIRSLWNILPHPPLQYIGPSYLGSLPAPPPSDQRYRSADGSYYNVMLPNLGRAGSAYARSVAPKTVLPPNLPDAGVLFDTMFARDKIIEHPTKMSSMLFYLATIIIHDVFKTDPMDKSRSNTSSYLDLAPLYGNNITEQRQVRTMADGKLKPDCFSEARILGFPPGVSVFLICFNRFHNYAASQLAVINEKGRFTKPSPLGQNPTPEDEFKYHEALVKYDEELFQTARLVTCGLYVQIILNDYVKNILNFNRTKSSWSLDPRGDYDHVFDQTTAIPSAMGNQVSAEFNLIYRWHACVGERDEKWTQDFFKDELKVDNPENLSVEELQILLKKWGHSIPREPEQRVMPGWKRQADGRFADADLVAELTKSTEAVAGSFGPKNIPKVLRSIEILGIEQARDWNMATLNEFRQFCGLRAHTTFEDINPDPEIARSLRIFYNHPDFVELYPGLLAEDAKEAMIPGSGLCASFTISKAILSDAVALVRSDRFYTTDFTPANLTNWGFNEVSTNPDLVNGRVIYKLLYTAFPGWYRADSVYAMFPFTVPVETKEILENLGTVDDFDFTTPSFVPDWTPIFSYKGVVNVLEDPSRFRVPWGPHIYQMTNQDYMLSGDEPANKKGRDDMVACMYGPKGGLDQITKFYEDTTLKLLKQKSYRIGSSYEVDVVRDVINLAHTHFSAAMFAIPLKTEENPHGIFTEQELYKIHAILFAWVFLDADPGKSFQLRQATRQAAEAFKGVVEPICRAIKLGKPILDVIDALHKDHGPMSIYGKHMIERIMKGKSVAETVGQILPTAGAAVARQSQGSIQMLEIFFTEKYQHHWPTIQALARDKTDPEAAFQKLRKYALEASRLSPAAYGVTRNMVAESATIDDGPNRTVNVKKGETVFVDFITACLDPEVFPNPHEIDLTRPEEIYLQYGYGPHSCIGAPIVINALASMLRVFGRLENLRRAPGPAGEMKYTLLKGQFRMYMTEDWSSWWPFPTTMKLHYDGIVE